MVITPLDVSQFSAEPAVEIDQSTLNVARKLGQEMVKRGIGLVYGGAPRTSASDGSHYMHKGYDGFGSSDLLISESESHLCL